MLIIKFVIENFWNYSNFLINKFYLINSDIVIRFFLFSILNKYHNVWLFYLHVRNDLKFGIVEIEIREFGNYISCSLVLLRRVCKINEFFFMILLFYFPMELSLWISSAKFRLKFSRFYFNFNYFTKSAGNMSIAV